MLDDTVKLDEPKFIRYGIEGFYCFGNCDFCKIKFMCWTGKIEINSIPPIAHWNDESLELAAFGNCLGRIIYFATLLTNFTRKPYTGPQVNKPVFAESKLLYLNGKGIVCCRKKAKSIHHVKDWQ